MSKQQSNEIVVPACFRAGDGLETSSAVTESLGALGGAPRGWPEALERARQAEFLLFRATSTGLCDDVLRLEGHLAELKSRWNEYIIEEIRRQSPAERALDEFNDLQKPSSVVDLELGIRNTERLLANARALYLSVPEEQQRLATRHVRDERRRRYDLRQPPTNDAEITALLDLADAVRADAEEQAAEQTVVKDLVSRATDAQHAARRILVRELVAQIHDSARQCKTVVGSKALRHAAFPAFADPAIGRSYSRAEYLAGLVHRLGAGEVPDVDAIFASALGADDWRTLSGVIRAQTGRWPVGGQRTK